MVVAAFFLNSEKPNSSSIGFTWPSTYTFSKAWITTSLGSFSVIFKNAKMPTHISTAATARAATAFPISFGLTGASFSTADKASPMPPPASGFSSPPGPSWAAGAPSPAGAAPSPSPEGAGFSPASAGPSWAAGAPSPAGAAPSPEGAGPFSRETFLSPATAISSDASSPAPEGSFSSWASPSFTAPASPLPAKAPQAGQTAEPSSHSFPQWLHLIAIPPS